MWAPAAPAALEHVPRSQRQPVLHSFAGASLPTSLTAVPHKQYEAGGRRSVHRHSLLSRTQAELTLLSRLFVPLRSFNHRKNTDMPHKQYEDKCAPPLELVASPGQRGWLHDEKSDNERGRRLGDSTAGSSSTSSPGTCTEEPAAACPTLVGWRVATAASAVTIRRVAPNLRGRDA